MSAVGTIKMTTQLAKAHQGIAPEMIQNLVVHRAEYRLNGPDHKRNQYGADPDTDFHGPVQGQQGAPPVKPVDIPAGQITAQSQSGHKYGKHRGHGKGRTAYDFVDQPYPDDLIDQAGSTGEEKTSGHKEVQYVQPRD